MSSSDDTIGMPRVVLAIRLVLLVLFAAGLTLALLFDWQGNPWIAGLGVALAVMSGVGFILFTVLGRIHGSYVDPMETKYYHYGGGRACSSDQVVGGGGGDSLSD